MKVLSINIRSPNVGINVHDKIIKKNIDTLFIQILWYFKYVSLRNTIYSSLFCWLKMQYNIFLVWPRSLNTQHVRFLCELFASKGYPFKSIFHSTISDVIWQGLVFIVSILQTFSQRKLNHHYNLKYS